MLGGGQRPLVGGGAVQHVGTAHHAASAECGPARVEHGGPYVRQRGIRHGEPCPAGVHAGIDVLHDVFRRRQVADHQQRQPDQFAVMVTEQR